ncbi:hypothetical protein KI387_014197 [Taxus chinensis]|uniref:NAC domain-containing protein n=1 Tax=Taxus chinensis TaxID=29808 RepID=A0AA38CTW7_TAXCH|nr:hypothetical protein KI387_014197 [Taxus chinensis]
MAPVSLPPGFRFHPSDEELLSYYLKKKIHGRKIELDIIPEVDLYKCEPWDLPNKSFLPNRDLEWYFFSPRDRKYPNGSRTNRATEAGYWKATGKDRKIVSQLSVMGMKKTLVFYMGRAPQGRRTDWVMHEYRLDEVQCEGAAGLQDAFVLCRVFKKNGTEQKNGEDIVAQIERTILSSSMNNSLPGDAQLLSEKSYSQIRQEEGGIHTNLTFPTQTLSGALHEKKDCNADLNWFLEFDLDDNNQTCSFKSPGNSRNDGKITSTSEGARIQQDYAHPVLKLEDFSDCLGDVSLNIPSALNGFPKTEKLNGPYQDASQDCNTHLEHSFSLDGSAGNSIRELLHEISLPCMGENYECFMVKELDGSPCEERYGFQECSQTSPWDKCQEILPSQIQGELKDTGSAPFQREMINLCRSQYKYSQPFTNSFDYSILDTCFSIPELYS